MRILGIDPGYAIVGFGILEADRGQAKLLGCGAINTPAGVLRLRGTGLRILSMTAEALRVGGGIDAVEWVR